jgi:hypothetical protein
VGEPAGGRHPRPRYTKDNYALVLITVVITICWGAAAPDTQWARLVTAILQATTLFGALRASSVTGRTLRLLVALWVVTLTAGIVAISSPSNWTTDVGQILGVLLILAALVAILRRLAMQPTVEMSTVLGAVAAYLMIGLFFAYSFAAMAEIGTQPPLAGIEGGRLNPFLYFSYITLSGVGYGDIAPITDLARSLAMIEALLGQIYLVTVIAVVVANAPRRRPRPEEPRSDEHGRADLH